MSNSPALFSWFLKLSFAVGICNLFFVSPFQSCAYLVFLYLLFRVVLYLVLGRRSCATPAYRVWTRQIIMNSSKIPALQLLHCSYNSNIINCKTVINPYAAGG